MALANGLTLSEAAEQAEVSARSVKCWIARGRDVATETDQPFGDFAVAVEAIRTAYTCRAIKLTEEGLRRVVSHAARNGSVRAMRLWWEMTR
jgi:hypothetical protein